MTPNQFVTSLAGLTFPNAFNPYSARCEQCDRSDAPSRRRAALLAILNAAAHCEVDSLWIGRDLGYRGGRRTGLALTDDMHVQAHLDRWRAKGARPTKGQPIAERTAAYIWQVLDQIDTPVFLWNVFPLHPHEADDPFTNRSHNAVERREGEAVLAALIDLLRPNRIIAIGNDAAKSAKRIAADAQCITVRHPSYGGQSQFLKQIADAYELINSRLF